MIEMSQSQKRSVVLIGTAEGRLLARSRLRRDRSVDRASSSAISEMRHWKGYSTATAIRAAATNVFIQQRSYRQTISRGFVCWLSLVKSVLGPVRLDTCRPTVHLTKEVRKPTMCRGTVCCLVYAAPKSCGRESWRATLSKSGRQKYLFPTSALTTHES